MNHGKQAFELFQTLSDSQKRFLIEKDMTDEKTIKEWLVFLQDIVRYDVLIDKTTKNLKLAIKLLWVVAVFNVVIAVVTQSIALGILALLMAGLAVYQRIKRASYFKRDLHNHLRLFFYPLLKALFDTAGPDMPLFADFRLREKDTSDYVISFAFPWDDKKSIKAKLQRDKYELNILVDDAEKQIIGDSLSVGTFLEQIKINIAS